MKRPPNFPALLESFFTQRLVAQRQASPHTIASYRGSGSSRHQPRNFSHGRPNSRRTCAIAAPGDGRRYTIARSLVASTP